MIFIIFPKFPKVPYKKYLIKNQFEYITHISRAVIFALIIF